MLTEAKVKVIKIIEKTAKALRIQTDGGVGRAILYRSLHQDVSPGDTVIVNTTATVLQLGTGGWDIVRAVVKADTPVASQKQESEKGHIMKGRYLGDQHSVLSVEAPESELHNLFQSPLHLAGKKVVLCELHSMLPVIWFLLRIKSPSTKLSVIISDEAALPLGISRHLAYLNKEPNFLSITVGQSFGGQKEAINIITALQYIWKSIGEGMILITVGPGVVGSNTYYGFSSMTQANWANMIGALGGMPVWIPRLSETDARSRHQGISHHTLTPLTELTLMESILPLPSGVHADYWLKSERERLSRYKHISIKDIKEERLLPYLQEVQQLSPFPLTTMGRTIDKDPLFFLGIAAAVFWYLDRERELK